MFAVAKTRWWRKPKYIVTLAAAVLGAVATIVAAVIIVSLEKTDPPQRHDTLRPISLPPTTSITEIKQVCGRRPQIDNRGEPAHVTYHLTIQNTSQKTVSVSVARLNIARIGYQPDPYPPSNLHWHGCGDFNFNKASVCIPAGATEGQSIHFEVNLELPPRSTR